MRSSAGLLGAALLVVVLTSGLYRHRTPHSHPAPMGSLRVMVRAGNPPDPLGGIMVRVVDLNIGAMTTASGIAVMSNLSPGSHTVRVVVIGQCTEQRNVTISAG